MIDSLIRSCELISGLFEEMHGVNASSWQGQIVNAFRVGAPDLVEDLDFCFEVLAGKHKLGFTMDKTYREPYSIFNDCTSLRAVYSVIKELTRNDKSEHAVYVASSCVDVPYQDFITKLFNREYRLGYSNRKNMVTNLHCMLAKKYPEDLNQFPEMYYIQEKLNGNRCIAWYDWDQDKWRFTSRSQKEKFYPFDMSQCDPDLIYDGEVMSRGAMGNRDFAKTSGLANSKYLDKSELVYVIYDILDSTKSYEERWEILSSMLHTVPKYDSDRFEFANTQLTSNVAILPVLAKIIVYPNLDYNWRLDELLDKIVEQGGEGIMLRRPSAPYYHSSGSGDRKNYLLKYKKLKTCDLRIVGWNEGKGKYEGMIGSFICEDDDHTVRVNVAGIDDDTRASDPDLWMGKIIEVAYFEGSQSKSKSLASLQFPRYKRVRTDKTETSLW